MPNASSLYRSPDTITKSRDSNVVKLSELRVRMQLQENFLHNQPHVVRKVCEFTSDRVQQNAILRLQTDLKPKIADSLGPKIRTWVDSHDESTLLEESFNSKLHFYLDTIIFAFCQDITDFCVETVTPYCEKTCRNLLSQLLPSSTEQAVIKTAQAITVDRTLRKWRLWQESILGVFVEEEVSQITKSYIKHVVAGVGCHVNNHVVTSSDNRNSLSGVLEMINSIVFSDQIVSRDEAEYTEADPVGLLRDLTMNKDITPLVQEIADRTVEFLIEYIKTPGCRLSFNADTKTEMIYVLLHTLYHKKSIEIPFLRVFTETVDLLTKNDVAAARFSDVCVALYSHGMLSPARLEHWFLWQRHKNPVYTALFNAILALIADVKNEFVMKIDSVNTKIPYFLKQYSVQDFERWYKANS